MKANRARFMDSVLLGTILLNMLMYGLIISLALSCPNAVAGTSVGGIIDSNTTWSKNDSPFWIEDSTVVASGVTLTIAQGVAVRFNGPYWLYVEGNLTIEGTVLDPVVFTSNMTTPSPADWLNVMVNSTGRVYVENASFSYGNAPFIFYYSEDNTIINCTFHDNFDPITVFRSNNNTFSRIEVRDNPNDAGMTIEDGQGNEITNSTFSNNEWGIVLDMGASNNTVTHNRMRNHSTYGVEAEAGSSANLIFHNDFINNSINGRDGSGGNNLWDNGYPAGGNYWDDYSGLDDLSGPNQDVPGSDGIGDSWYLVAPSGTDRYPFMEPLIPVVEPTPPEILGVSVLPQLQESGLYVNVSADIVDDDFVVGVYLEVRLPDMTMTNDSMMLESPSTYYLNTTYRQPGQYYFNVSAVDSDGLWNRSSGTFSVVDTTSPWMVNISANPGVQEVYLPVNISATIQDNDLVDFVSFNISCPDSSWTNLTPSNVVQDLYWEELSFSVLGQHNLSIHAIDRTGNSNSSSITFTVSDSTPPSILSFQASHSSQEVNGFVNITAVVQDNYALESVFLNLSFPSGSYSNESMLELAPSEYYLNETSHEVGDHFATLWGTDTSGNTATQSLTFSIVDGSSPVITTVSIIPPLQNYGGNVNVSAQVSDDHALGYVDLDLTLPDASPISYPMTKGEAGLYYINQTYEFIGVAQFVIESADLSGNVQTYPGSFEMRDMTCPEILSAYASPDIQEAGDFLSLVADIEDNHNVWGVWADVRHPDSSKSNHTMSWNETSQLYDVRLSFRHYGAYEFDVWTNDTSNNWNHSNSTFLIVDTASPEILDVSVTPDPQEVGEAVNVTVLVSDGGIISQVYVEAEAPESGTIGNASCTSLDGASYSALLVPTELGVYELTIVALDSADNLAAFDSGFTTIDTTSPIAHAGEDRTVERGHTVLLNASLSQDNHRISECNWSLVEDGQVRYLGGVAVQYSFLSVGNFTVTLTVKDPSRNVATDFALVTVEDTTPPNPPQYVRVVQPSGRASLKVTWEPNTEDDLDHYVVLRTREREGEYEPIATVERNETSIVDNDVREGVRYSYAVIAVDDSGNPSDMSETVSNVAEGDQTIVLALLVVALAIVLVVLLLVIRKRKKRFEDESQAKSPSLEDE